MAKEPFTSFKPEDFEIEATSENDRYRTGRFRKLLEALKSSLSDSFENTSGYVNVAGKQGTKKGQHKEYRDHTWLSIRFGEDRDTLQFQVSLYAEGVAAFINCDATSRNYRRDLLTAFEEHKDKCFDILKKLDSYFSSFYRSFCLPSEALWFADTAALGVTFFNCSTSSFFW